jgi:integrase
MSIHKKQTKSGPRYQVKWRRIDGSQASKSFRTKKEAETWQAQVISERAKGTLIDERRGKIPFKELVSEYLANKTHQRTTTIRRREGNLNKHILPALGDRPICHIRHSDVQTMVTKWVNDGLAPRTIKQHIQVMKPIFDYAVKDDMIAKNPTKGLNLPRVEESQHKALTGEECHRLLENIPEFYRAFIYITLATGMRWQEITSLQVGDLDLLKSELTIRESKTDAGRRTIELSATDVEVIAGHLAATGRTAASPDGPLFTSPKGSTMHGSNFRQRVFYAACEAAGLDGLTFHDLRRTHATALVAAGVDPKSIQQRLGHRDISTTLKTYAQVTADGRKRAASVMNDFLAFEVDKDSHKSA